MRKRTKAREYALQLLYQVDISRAAADDAIREFWVYHQVPPEVREFADRLVRGTLRHLPDIDRHIAEVLGRRSEARDLQRRVT